MSSTRSTAVAASAARTATGNSGAFRAPGTTALAILADVTAVDGVSPSMTLSVEWSHDGTTFAVVDTADTFAALTATATKVKRFDIKGGWFRLVWTLTGTTPSFTFSATAYGI